MDKIDLSKSDSCVVAVADVEVGLGKVVENLHLWKCFELLRKISCVKQN